MIKRLVMLLPEVPQAPRSSHAGQIEVRGRQSAPLRPDLHRPQTDCGAPAWQWPGAHLFHEKKFSPPVPDVASSL
jgi:hypothetical protein